METFNIKTETISLYESTLHLRNLLSSVLIQRKVREDILNSVKLAFTEAVNNIIQHSYANSNGYIGVEIDISAEGFLKIILSDKGKSIEEEDLIPKEVDELSESGRGLRLIHSIVDNFEFVRKDNINILTLTKKLEVGEAYGKSSLKEVDIEIIEFFEVFKFIGNDEKIFSEFFKKIEDKIYSDIYFLYDKRRDVVHTHITRNFSINQIEQIKEDIELETDILAITEQSKALIKHRNSKAVIADKFCLSFDEGGIIILKIDEVEYESKDKHNIADDNFFDKIGIELKKENTESININYTGQQKFFDYEKDYISKLEPIITTMLNISSLHNEAVEYKYEIISRLEIFKELSDVLIYFNDPKRVTARILEILLKNFKAEVGFINFKFHDKKNVFSMGLDPNLVGLLKTSDDKNVLSIFNTNDETLYFDDNYLINANEHNISNIIMAHIISKESRIADVIIGNASEKLFNDEISRLGFDILLYLSGTILENSLFYIESIENEMMKKDLELAKEIQHLLFPKTFPKTTDFEFAAFAEPAKNIGGDYYDVIMRDNGKIVIVIADVSGKGIGPGLLMANLRGYLRGNINTYESIEDFVSYINNILVNDISDDKFITMAAGFLDPEKGSIDIVNAGHLPLALIRNNGQIEKLYSDSLPLGIMENEKFTKKSIKLNNNDSLFFYTDGVIEQSNNSGEEFGEDNLVELLTETKNLSAQSAVTKIKSEFEEFSYNSERHDDCTFLLLKKRKRAQKKSL